MNRKGIVPAAVLIVTVIVMLVLAGAYLYFVSKAPVVTSLPQSPVTNNSHAGWHTYTDNDSRFLILLPPGFTARMDSVFNSRNTSVYLPNAQPHSIPLLISIQYSPPGTQTAHNLFDTYVLIEQGIQESYSSTTYSTSSITIGNLSGLAVFTSGPMNNGAMYAVEGTAGQAYQILANYEAGVSSSTGSSSIMAIENSNRTESQDILATFKEITPPSVTSATGPH